jgi:hypothetical protein
MPPSPRRMHGASAHDFAIFHLFDQFFPPSTRLARGSVLRLSFPGSLRLRGGFQRPQIFVQTIEALRPEVLVVRYPVGYRSQRSWLQTARSPLRVPPRAISPARSSTLRCLETAGCDIAKGSASSLTVTSPDAKRARIARRVGSARAPKMASRSLAFISKPSGYIT